MNVTVAATDSNETAATTTELTPVAEFEVGVDRNDDGSATVTVTRNDTAVENASVTVTADDAYAGTGNYTTDSNGTVTIAEPESTVTVTVEATDANDTATATAELTPADGLAVDVTQNADGAATVTVTRNGDAVENASVNVTADGDYAGVGTYATDANGTVSSPRRRRT
ncbi:hypothetical protein ACFQJD_09565 [Haloplanus sp. GCM10025708]|uniref:hypothetical protein n=1 Tax=Haloplanus sp. GCM10025708 TaxID=3252679 RepID=UPI003611D794